jgi:hypothetical protein
MFKIDRSLIVDISRDKYVERCKQRAFDFLDRDDLKNAVVSFDTTMNARPELRIATPLGSAWCFTAKRMRSARGR